MMGQNSLGVVGDNWIVLDEPFLGLFGRRFVLRSPWVKEPAREGLNLAIFVGNYTMCKH